ncbi:hypothetical protein Syn7803US17_53 [Synechococcus phage ACG-2014f]|uniref:Uncharacterized protein n=1 Tax=Synechococcus phage ACG-2014f TaxID=1493511 RepID=A0A0E3FJ78_9CAUD|nr:hypothetical protein Syn7803US17_53 [Synechococcus phage ACG-2014f]
MQLPTPLLNRGYIVDGNTASRVYQHGFIVELEALTTLNMPIGLLNYIINENDIECPWAPSDVEQFDTIWHYTVTDIRGEILDNTYGFTTYYMFDSIREIHNALTDITVDNALDIMNGTSELYATC